MIPNGSGLLLGAMVLRGEEIVESVPYGCYIEDDPYNEGFDDFRTCLTELEVDDVISAPEFLDDSQQILELEQEALRLITENISPGAGYGRRIFDELEKYGRVISGDQLSDFFTVAMGNEGQLSMTIDELNNFSSELLRDGDECMRYEFVDDEDLRDVLQDEDPCLDFLFEEKISDLDSNVNVLEEVIQTMSQSKKKQYFNKNEVPINVGNRKLIFKRSLKEMMGDGKECRLELENSMRVKSDLFWIGSNGVVQMDEGMFVLGEPALCMRIKRKDKFYRAFFFCYEVGYSIPKSIFRFSYPFDVGFKVQVRDDGSFSGKKKKRKKGKVEKVMFCGHRFQIKKEQMQQLMRFFPKRRFMFGEFTLSGDRKLNACVSRTKDGEKRMRLTSPENSCKNLFVGENEIYRYSKSYEEEFYMDVFGSLRNLRMEGPVHAEVSVRLWFEFYLKE